MIRKVVLRRPKKSGQLRTRKDNPIALCRNGPPTRGADTIEASGKPPHFDTRRGDKDVAGVAESRARVSIVERRSFTGADVAVFARSSQRTLAGFTGDPRDTTPFPGAPQGALALRGRGARALTGAGAP